MMRELTISSAIKMLLDEWIKAQAQTNHIRKPISKALHETWKFYDANEPKRELIR